VNLYQSGQLHNRAMEIIPTGTQTFSKGRFLYPTGMPLYIERGKGSHVWDVDGNEYIDFVSGLCPIILGYCDPDVDSAVKAQMESGVIFSLPHRLEIEVSEKLCEIIPCAEMVRFGKNGSDATAGAVRLARAYTGRDHIITVAGHYHGWADWYIGITARNAGVPQAIRELTHTFEYNDIDSLHALFRQYPNQVACVIMEPMSLTWPEDGFLEAVKELTHKNGAILIFDEVITGLRMAMGGAQEYFGVIPDIACFGKAIANGYPLSAVVGKSDIMSYFGKVHFSFTNGGECLSLAASKATLEKMERDSVVDALKLSGAVIFRWFMDHTPVSYSGPPTGYKAQEINISGYPARTVINFPSDEMKWNFMRECAKRGILTIGCHNLMYSHTVEDITKLLSVYDEVFPLIQDMKFNGYPPLSSFNIRWF